tara:strand:+ start:306 stop:881 length:576 start_codon:yes stop_codon:yes gene_type:complete
MIFLDIDGVIVDFVGGALKAHRRKLDYSQHKGEYDMCKLLDMTPEEFWSKLDDPLFWIELEIYDGFYKFWEEIYELDQEIYLLSSPSRAVSSYAGKYVWYQQNIYKGCKSSGVKPPKLILTSQKHLLAAPDRILIDDNDRNVEAWRKAGGIGLQFPQYWNSSHKFADLPTGRKYNTFKRVLTKLKNMEQES